jgi:hypothetical protein
MPAVSWFRIESSHPVQCTRLRACPNVPGCGRHAQVTQIRSTLPFLSLMPALARAQRTLKMLLARESNIDCQASPITVDFYTALGFEYVPIGGLLLSCKLD